MATQGDFVALALGATETTETSLGTIQIPATGITRIVGIYGICSIVTPTTAEGTAGNFRLAFKTLAGNYQFPATIVYGPLTSASAAGAQAPQIIPVNIPVPPLETVTCFMALDKTQTGVCNGTVGLIME